MEAIIARQLQLFAQVGAQTFTGWWLLAMAGLFVLLALLLLKRCYALYRVLRLLRRSFSEAGMQSSPLLQKYWAEYSHTFLLDLQQNNKTLRDATEFFSPERIIGETLDLRWWRFAPHLLFACGMAAVLAQLIYGLVLFDLSSPDAIMQSIEHGFLAIANGFVALLAGMLLSLAMYFTLRKVYGGLAGRIQDFAAMLNRRYRISALEEREITLAEYAKTLTRIVHSLFADAPAGATLTPGALTKALLEQARLTNRLLQERPASLSSEQLQELGQAAGLAMAAELRPLLQETKQGAPPQPHSAQAPAAADVQSLAAALQASSLALQDFLHERPRRQSEKHSAESLDAQDIPRGPKQ